MENRPIEGARRRLSQYPLDIYPTPTGAWITCCNDKTYLSNPPMAANSGKI
jgi:hypothetical protein